MTADGLPSNAIVFIVDDDAGVRASLLMLMRSIGLDARTFDSGEAFLSAFDANACGCVLLDVRMPGMSGLEVRQELAALDAEIPVIFLTAQGEEEIPESIGRVERVQKPFRDDYLVRRVRELTRPAPGGLRRAATSPMPAARMAEASAEASDE
jgi:FixJ family two-component response regulator